MVLALVFRSPDHQVTRSHDFFRPDLPITRFFWRAASA
jgi:hypothetical protein